MSPGLKTARNLAIVALIAAAIAFLPGGGTAASTIGQIFSIVFLAALAFLAYRLYREYRVALFSLGDRNRGVLYASGGAATLALVGTKQLWNSAPGTLVWLALVIAASVGLVTVIRAVRRY